MIFDEDELENAYNTGNVSRIEFDMTHEVMKQLIDDKIIDVTYMSGFCERLLSLFK